MRLLLVLASLLLPLALGAAARPARDWSAVARPTPAGYLIGNPNARLKLVEYASYTCSHCAHFANESGPELKDRIRTGSTSFEYRHYFFNALDLGVAVLARCTGPRGFAATNAYIFSTQAEWLPRAEQFSVANTQRLNAYPPLGRMRALVDGSGLTAAIVARGLTPAAVDRCFADQAAVNRLTAMMTRIPAGIAGTPSFYLNGRPLSERSWAEIAPRLRPAPAR